MRVLKIKMQREEIEEALQRVKSAKPLPLPEDVLSRFKLYFGPAVQSACNEKIISDESLFRDYSRFGDRKVDFLRVRNPFTLSKYTISSYEKTWFIKDPGSGALEGPHNSYEMDNLFKKGRIAKETLVGVLRDELFRFDSFVEIAYPLPKMKYKDNAPATAVKDMGYFTSANKFSKIFDESEMLSNKGSKRSRESTPFKRTPFKNLGHDSKTEQLTGEKFVPIPNENGQIVSSSKAKPGMLINNLVAERFLVKGRNKGAKLPPQSAKEPSRVESDVGGNYTAVKRDVDERQYVNLSKKIEFNKDEKEDSEEHEEGELDFDDIGIKKH